ncbi:MAG: sigma 54-interacting transcriptional regulator [Deltaproteobacteria bacterium]|jgi:PAS domain S-box-containing protein|nr:sigma 54-interacting transcriptional regulator [Deltaproteobacteria bacterium]
MFIPTPPKKDHITATQNPPLSSLEASFIETLDSLPIGVVLLSQEGKILDTNSKAAKHLESTRDDLRGVPLSQIWPQTAAEISLALSGGRQSMGMVPHELDNCYIQVNAMENASAGASISIFDQSLNKEGAGKWQSDDPLAMYYKEIFDYISDGISIVDNKGRIIFMNPAAAKLVGVSQDGIQGSTVSYFMENNVASDIISYDVLATGKPVTRLVHCFKTGKHVLLTGTPIFNSKGEVYLVIVNDRDLTELLELQTSLQQQKLLASRFKDELSELKMAELAERDVVAKSPTMMRRIETAAKLARYDTHQMLLTGETGVGKGLLAKFIHSKSKRASEPFIHINCTSLPEQLLEAELFGYEKDAFPGAGPEGRAGHFEVASKGTVYLEEISGMSLSLQTKLLTFLETRSFRRINGHQILSSDCSVIAATNYDLRELSEKKLFRMELYLRLNVFSLSLPPLRQRKDDIMELARRELISLNQRYNQKMELDHLALEVLLNYPFPGNVRELFNCLHQAVLLSEKPQIGDFLMRLLDQSAKRIQMDPSGKDPSHVQLYDNIAETEKKSLEKALDACKNTREMAAFLGISQAGVSRKLRKYGLPLPKNSQNLLKS